MPKLPPTHAETAARIQGMVDQLVGERLRLAAAARQGAASQPVQGTSANGPLNSRIQANGNRWA